MKAQSFICDVCHAPKGETNGWWGARLRAIRELLIRPWHDWTDESEMTHHLCGEGCALKFFERYLANKLDEGEHHAN